MHELVIVIADLHLPSDAVARERGAPPAAGPVAWPGIEHVARFARPVPLSEGWRRWVARWLGVDEYGHYPVASVAAAAVEVPAGRACWIATPLHLVEGLTRVHVDWSCLLRLPPEQRERLAVDFKETFRGSGFDLLGLESGEFLLTAPALGQIRTFEPAYALQIPIADALPSGEGAGALRRLGSEIEMWLHAHPLNSERTRRGERPVSTLWIWGGGKPPAPAAASRPSPVGVFSSDAYVRGLCRLAGLDGPLTTAEGSVMNGATAPRTLCVLEVVEMLQAHAGMSLSEAVAELDRRVIAAAVAAQRRGRIGRVVLLANERRWTLRTADRWRFWRRKRAGLEALV